MASASQLDHDVRKIGCLDNLKISHVQNSLCTGEQKVVRGIRFSDIRFALLRSVAIIRFCKQDYIQSNKKKGMRFLKMGWKKKMLTSLGSCSFIQIVFDIDVSYMLNRASIHKLSNKLSKLMYWPRFKPYQMCFWFLFALNFCRLFFGFYLHRKPGHSSFPAPLPSSPSLDTFAPCGVTSMFWIRRSFKAFERELWWFNILVILSRSYHSSYSKLFLSRKSILTLFANTHLPPKVYI